MDEAREAVRRLTELGLTLATAESCTGGLLGKCITDVPGASAVYLGGVISYAYAVKEQVLGVSHELLETKGAVCEEVAVQMAEGVRKLLRADFALATTGNAGPGTDPLNPEVGTIYVACASAEKTVVSALHLDGSREANRNSATKEAYRLLLTAEKLCKSAKK